MTEALRDKECPYFARGRCWRPNCLQKHTLDVTLSTRGVKPDCASVEKGMNYTGCECAFTRRGVQCIYDHLDDLPEDESSQPMAEEKEPEEKEPGSESAVTNPKPPETMEDIPPEDPNATPIDPALNVQDPKQFPSLGSALAEGIAAPARRAGAE
jgi:hypothetical protein